MLRHCRDFGTLLVCSSLGSSCSTTSTIKYSSIQLHADSTSELWNRLQVSLASFLTEVDYSTVQPSLVCAAVAAVAAAAVLTYGLSLSPALATILDGN